MNYPFKLTPLRSCLRFSHLFEQKQLCTLVCVHVHACPFYLIRTHSHSSLRCPFRDCEGERECKVVWDTSEIYLMSSPLHIHTHSYMAIPEALLDYSRRGLKLSTLGGRVHSGMCMCDKCGYHETSFSNEIHDTHMHHIQNFNGQHVFRTAKRFFIGNYGSMKNLPWNLSTAQKFLYSGKRFFSFLKCSSH